MVLEEKMKIRNFDLKGRVGFMILKTVGLTEAYGAGKWTPILETELLFSDQDHVE